MNGRSAFSAIRAGGLAAALVLLQLTAQAGTITNASKGFGTTYTTGVYTYADMGDGLPSVPQTFSTTATGGANSGNITIHGGADGSPRASTSSKAPIPGSGGRSVPVEATAKVPKAAAGAAIAKFAMRAGAIFSGFGLGMATYDLLKDLGWLMKRNPDGSTSLSEQINTSSCTGTPSDGYYSAPTLTGCRWKAGPGGYGVASTPEAACNYLLQGKYGGGSVVYEPGAATYGNCRIFYPNGSYRTLDGVVRTGTPTTGTREEDRTEQQLADKIASMSGWPTNASRALADAIKNGETVPHEAPTVSGPASVAGPTTTKDEPATKKNPDGSTAKDANGNPITGNKRTTTSTTYNNTYNGGQVKITNNTTNVYNFTWSDGTTSTEQGPATSEEAPAEPEQKDPCDANPDRAGCVKLGDPSAEDQLEKQTKPLTVTPTSFAGGACPPPVSFSVFSQSYAFSYSPLCEKLALIAPLVMALGAFVAAWILADSFKVS